ncbi:uncharacterized protein STEHIDRAFT_54230 [Stereum hirsutum FP-91666 SS1]|uniref:uncharacterized protein n=1 Tax=Stereum hirsutum (strain FP-91666) TaxID=721885 RepID=UPI000440D532|nr:uncharacterized protein STEHIDRAFT_54230 [Stereum hirsutum FP-91666 SS1]EIM87943.1 hypothetical protein STEHIDRAFT_54230 [Stereum hirsutum FP-91666 SS1]
MADLEPLDPQFVQTVLSNPPFVSVPGVHNVRDLGSYPAHISFSRRTNEESGIEGDRNENASLVTRPGYMFRSAEVSGITEEGEAQLLDLGISTIFDLRSETEMKKYNTPLPALIHCHEKVAIVKSPVFEQKDYSPEMMARRFQLYASGKVEAFMQLYTEILEAGGPAYGSILRHVRDKPQEGFIFHCTAGKDRTGIMAAILLLLAGVSREVIATDYSLTRIGREPQRPQVLSRLSKEPIFASNQEAALNMLTSRSTMIAFLEMFEEQYGGAENYAKNFCHLSDGDLDVIKSHLVVERPISLTSSNL